MLDVDEPIPEEPRSESGVPPSPSSGLPPQGPSAPEGSPSTGSAPEGPAPERSEPEQFQLPAEPPPFGSSAARDSLAEQPIDEAETKSKRHQSATRQAVEWVVFIAVALGIALLIKTFLFQAFFIPSESMVPTLKVHDRVLVNKLSYKMHPVHRGDIVVFKRPPNEPSDIKDLVKRVIALPGETVEGRNGHVYINGRLLEEPYLPRGTLTETFSPVTIPANSVWVMGDNRQNSADSHVFGPIRESSIVGRVFLRIWPLSRIGFL
jgi:signal peptidase I